MSLQIEVLIDSSVQSPTELDAIKNAALQAARARGFREGEIGIRVTNDETIQQVNRTHLEHDYPTDVISFAYHAESPRIEGELIVSVDTANRRASELGWNPSHELLLYTVHGVLHLTGMDDHDRNDRSEMRKAEKAILLELGISEIARCGVDIEQGADTDPNAVTENRL